MRILFICGSVDPGYDGVGDYSRNLAGSFIEHGYEAAILAINERQLFKDTINFIQQEGDLSINTYRLSSQFSWRERQKLANEIIFNYKPDVISLQVVPFSFHAKGLPFFLPNWFQGLKRPSQVWHVMFHELWVADSKAHSYKEYVTRELQRFIIRNLLNSINPDKVSTSNRYYKYMLAKIGCEAFLMPIFSNLPKGTISDILPIKNRADKIVGVLFGSFLDSDLINEQVEKLAKMIKLQLNKKLIIFQIGNKSSKVNDFLTQLNKLEGVHASSLGFLSADAAANVMASANIGLSNYLPEFVQKSGSIAAMLYNGLPVVLLRTNVNPMEEASPEIAQLENITDIGKFISIDKSFEWKYSAENSFNLMEYELLMLKN
jgi:hypothetical protein